MPKHVTVFIMGMPVMYCDGYCFECYSKYTWYSYQYIRWQWLLKQSTNITVRYLDVMQILFHILSYINFNIFICYLSVKFWPLHVVIVSRKTATFWYHIVSVLVSVQVQQHLVTLFRSCTPSPVTRLA